jgi:hypothetical protein
MTFSPTLTLGAATVLVRNMGLSARRIEDGLGLFTRNGRIMLAHETDPAAAVMVAAALAADISGNRIKVGGVATAKGYESVAFRVDGRTFGFTGGDWQPNPAERFYCQSGESGPFAFGATPAAALAALLALEAAAAAEDSFIASHAAPLPAALTPENVATCQPFRGDVSDRESAIAPSENFATLHAADGRPVATYHRPAFVGGSGPFKGLHVLTLTDGRVVAASERVLTLAGVRRALADYLAATAEPAEFGGTIADRAAGLESMARVNFRAAANPRDAFRGSAAGRAARMARRAALTAATVDPTPGGDGSDVLAGNPPTAAEESDAAAQLARLREQAPTPMPCQQQQARHVPAGTFTAPACRNLSAVLTAIATVESIASPETLAALHDAERAARAELAAARHGARVVGTVRVSAELAAELALRPVRPAAEPPLVPVALSAGADVTLARLGRGDGFAELVGGF